jgi:hypothetical protein
MLLSTDIALRGATVALLLVLAASLFRGFGTVLAGRLAAAFALGSAAHAVTASIGGQGGACRSQPDGSRRHYDRDGCRLPVARAVQPRL